MEPTLLILAAGMGSRYGGLKQLDPMGPSGETVLDYSVFDAIRAGLKDGSFSIWKGPIVGQDGKEVLAKDVVADDKFLGGVKFYVKGVEGKVPN